MKNKEEVLQSKKRLHGMKDSVKMFFVKNKKRLQAVLGWAILLIVLTFLYLPLIMIIAYSFSSAKTVGGEGIFTLMWYRNLLSDTRLMNATANTLIIGLVSSLIATVIGSVSAVGIFYMRRGKKVVSSVTQITVVNTEIVTAVGFFLLFIFLKNVIHLPVKMGMVWLIFLHAVLTTPYVILTVSPRLHQLNPNLFEAGMDLGAGAMRTLFTVIFPQLVKGMISGFALAFTLSLDDFVVTKMNQGSVNTISTYVYDNIKRNLSPTVRALSSILFITVMVILVVVNLISANKRKKSKKV